MTQCLVPFQLAADASNTIAMTDDEKKRLEDLLSDIERVPEAFQEETTVRTEVSRESIHVYIVYIGGRVCY